MSSLPDPERFSRTELLLGPENLAKLQRSFVIVLGLGAVGSACTEALARAGVGRFKLVDFDVIRSSNINRHIWAFASTLGQPKVVVGRARLLDINPEIKVDVSQEFAAEESLDAIFAERPDAVVDAIDSLNPKMQVLKNAYKRGFSVFSSMGAATRLDPAKVRTGDLLSTRGCPLAARIRRRLKEQGVGRGIQCVYSEEARHIEALSPEALREEGDYDRGRARRKLGSLSTLTGIFGLTLANLVIQQLIANKQD